MNIGDRVFILADFASRWIVCQGKIINESSSMICLLADRQVVFSRPEFVFVTYAEADQACMQKNKEKS